MLMDVTETESMKNGRTVMNSMKTLVSGVKTIE